ncbi:MAG: PPOX class F420-dependent oxidoreductase [Candidatus Dormibacteria bacterium]
MSVFTDAEVEYLAGQRLGRLATVGPGGRPHVMPVAFLHNRELDVIDIQGYGMTGSKKFRDVVLTGLAAFVVDDATEAGPRLLEVRGRAESLTGVDGTRDGGLIRIHPERVVALNVEPGGGWNRRGV